MTQPDTGCSVNHPTDVKGISHVVSVAVGDSHMLALTAAHGLWAWGDNSFGELAIDSSVTRESAQPTFIRIDNEATDIGAGDQFSLVVRSSAL